MEINGATVEVSKCPHPGCTAEPTMEEIRRAVYRAQNHRTNPSWRCAYCGEPIKATSYGVYHDSEGWIAGETKVEPSVGLNILPQHRGAITENNGLHLRCVEKALPFVNGLAQKAD
jgi:hypothetical protein